jgi:biopolymer transport protein ExbD
LIFNSAKRAEQTPAKPRQIEVAVDAAGLYQINDTQLGAASVDALAEALKRAAGSESEPVVVINADAHATHQSVINVMEAARRAGLVRITFATQTSR